MNGIKILRIQRKDTNLSQDLLEVYQSLKNNKDMKIINCNDLVDFVMNNDFAFVYGAGIMYANDVEVREWIAGIVNKDGKEIAEVEDLEEEGCGCEELSEEKENGCVIYKVWNTNEEPLYIAYYF